MVAQGAHASLGGILDHCTEVGDGTFVIGPGHTGWNWEAVKLWLSGKFTKIVVGVETEQELLDLYGTALRAGIACFLCTDAGDTEFHGVPTNTAVCIGPDFPDVIDPITGHLRLL